MKEQIIRFEEIYINDKVGSNNYRPITEAKIIGDLIRCKDCKHWTDENGGLCDIWGHYISNEEFFCGCGERREP